MDVNNIITKIDNISQNRAANVRNQTERVATPAESKKPENNFTLTRENMDNLVDTLNSAAKSVHQRVSFSFHDKTNRVIMKFINGDTNEVIREVPPKEMIRLLEHMHELIGMFVDESR